MTRVKTSRRPVELFDWQPPPPRKAAQGSPATVRYRRSPSPIPHPGSTRWCGAAGDRAWTAPSCRGLAGKRRAPDARHGPGVNRCWRAATDCRAEAQPASRHPTRSGRGLPGSAGCRSPRRPSRHRFLLRSAFYRSVSRQACLCPCPSLPIEKQGNWRHEIPL